MLPSTVLTTDERLACFLMLFFRATVTPPSHTETFDIAAPAGLSLTMRAAHVGVANKREFLIVIHNGYGNCICGLLIYPVSSISPKKNTPANLSVEGVV